MMPSVWWAAPADEDLAAPATVRPLDVSGLSSRLRLAKSPAGTAPRLLAARPYAVGELILAELAAAFITCAPVGAPPDAPTCAGTRLCGPFASAGTEAVRLAAQLLAARPRSGVDVLAKGASRAAVLAAACAAGHVLPCTVPAAWLRGGIVGKKDDGDVRRDGSGGGHSNSGSGAGATGDEDAPPVSGRALFARGSLLRHSCLPSVLCIITFDVTAGAPALHLVARRSISAGEELTLCRLADASQSRPVRAMALRAALGLECCDCVRCTAAEDDAEVVRCPVTASCAGAVRLRSPAPCEVVGGAALAACPICGIVADCESAAKALMDRESALATLGAAAATAAAAKASDDVGTRGSAAAAAAAALAMLHPSDGPALHGGLAVLREATSPRRSGDGKARPSAAEAAAALAPVVALSEAVAVAARAAPYLDPTLLQELLIDHALLCAMAGDGTRGVSAWRDVATLARLYNPTRSPMHELFTSFVAKPPRNANEAAAARRMRAVAAESLASARA